jgi:hypothetical protein
MVAGGAGRAVFSIGGAERARGSHGNSWCAVGARAYKDIAQNALGRRARACVAAVGRCRGHSVELLVDSGARGPCRGGLHAVDRDFAIAFVDCICSLLTVVCSVRDVFTFVPQAADRAVIKGVA